jgi:hypothetical protein
MEKHRDRCAQRAIVWAFATLGLVACTPKPSVVGGTGGISGGAGESTNGAGGTDQGAGGAWAADDASVPQIKLDVPPAWWGTSDAAQEPDTPSTPTVDSNCGLLNSRTERQPADVMLVLDRSASMDYSITSDCYCSNVGGMFGNLCTDTTDCTTRWDALKPALTTTLASSSYVNWGLKFFPTASSSPTGGGPTGVGRGNCNENTAMEVPVAGDSAAEVTSLVTNADFDLGTPTAAAINAATDYLKTLDDGNDKFILLATDGEPNCGGTPANINTDDLEGAKAAAAAAYAAGFKVFVVGIGPNLENLTEIAQTGGTTDFYSVSSPDDLVAALSSISKLVGSCSFKSATTPPDTSNVAVYVNGQKVEGSADNGWTFGSDPQEIVLTGDYCKQMSSGDQTDVQILFGCPGQPDFPPKIY